MTVKSKRKIQSFSIDTGLIKKIAERKIEMNDNRKASEGVITLSDIVNFALKEYLK